MLNINDHGWAICFLRFSRWNGRRAISEVLGSLIMIAITLVAGAAVFGFVNGQSGASSQAIGNSAAQNINFLNEKESVIYAGRVNATLANVWVYNNGIIDPLTITLATVINGTTPGSLACSIALSGVTVGRGNVTSVAVKMPDNPTTTPPCPVPFTYVSTRSYTFKIYGQFGSTSQLVVTL